MKAAGISEKAEDYIFRFDQPLPPLVIGGEFDLAGWLLHREGKPIQGLRALVRSSLRGEQTVRGRRKRLRPDVGAAFPHLPDAEASGFLLELRFGFGRNQLAFQVLDHERRWHTFATASVFALPLTSLDLIGFSNTRRFVAADLEKRFARTPPEGSASAGRRRAEGGPSGSLPTTTRVELFATSKSNLFIIEIGELVVAGFRELGYEAQLQLDRVPAADPPDGTIQIVLTPHEFYNLFLRENFALDELRALSAGVHLLCTEQPDTGWFQSNLEWGAYARSVADISRLGMAAYRARGLSAQHLQLGYHPILEQAGDTPHGERQYDLTFLGSMTPRREEFFARHASFVAAHRCHLRLVPLGFAKTKTTQSYLTVERRNELLSQTRILLNLHYSEQKYFEWHRMLVGLANGCCIISETCRGYGELVPGRHFVMVEPEYLLAACEHYLAHPEECAEIARAGRDFIEKHLRQSETCGSFLREIEQGSESDALSIPADAMPAPLPAALQQIISRETRRLLGEAFKKDVGAMAARFTRKAPDHRPVPKPLEQDQRAAVLERRRAYKTRLGQQEEAQLRDGKGWSLSENKPFADAGEPRLSVLITLYNYAQHIEECVESITRSAERMAEPLEIVIVNDTSTDDSLARAQSCQQRSSLPIRIVDKRFNTGLADARNVGLRIARAPYVFMMDADNLVFPEALPQLLRTISEGGYAAAYSVLARFQESPANRVGLLSYYDWDPQILVQYPYIDAMAMFDRHVLLELGGYDGHLSQIGWFGWEDYDMWLRLAQHEKRVGFVPNTLCLYRQHETSMINTTNLFEAELVEHFMSHYGELLARFEPREKAFGVEREKALPRPKTL